VKRRILSVVLVGQLVLLAACTDGGPPPAAPSTEGSPMATATATRSSAGPTEPTPTSDDPEAPTPTSDDPEAPTPTSAEPTEPSPDPPATPSPSADPEEQVLLDRAREEGELSVIVEVAVEGTAAASSAEKRRLVAEAQDDLIAELDPAHVSVQTRFETTAQLTLTVDEEGLLALFDSSRVTSVWENESIPLE
jgi:type IV secretory pathway VirB10-like protein